MYYCVGSFFLNSIIFGKLRHIWVANSPFELLKFAFRLLSCFEIMEQFAWHKRNHYLLVTYLCGKPPQLHCISVQSKDVSFTNAETSSSSGGRGQREFISGHTSKEPKSFRWDGWPQADSSTQGTKLTQEWPRDASNSYEPHHWDEQEVHWKVLVKCEKYPLENLQLAQTVWKLCLYVRNKLILLLLGCRRGYLA